MAANENKISTDVKLFWPDCFALLAGIFFGLALLKFGNPVILDGKIAPPINLWEALFQPWPIKWGYILLAPIGIAGLFAANWKTQIPKWALLLPTLWLGWQFISTTQTVDAALTSATLKHFSACVFWFYLGCFGLKNCAHVWLLWIGMLLGFVVVLSIGFDQHFGGLEETRRYFYQLPNWRESPPDFLKKISSNRIFSTFVYPNALAGGILLFLPIMVAVIFQIGRRLMFISRCLLAAAIGTATLACLYWSGSKAGWIVALLITLVALFHLKISTKAKMLLVATVLATGMAGFFLTHANYFERGATSLGARFDYWRAALKIASDHPLLGTGPGTFSIPYQKMKSPEAEMARLTHNDYLEQASDSGFIGFLAYFAFICGVLIYLYRYRLKQSPNLNLMQFGIWIGLLGLTLHSIVEFHLYIPALAWPMFFFFGWLLSLTASTNPSTNFTSVPTVAVER